jgi:hypothetical protein
MHAGTTLLRAMQLPPMPMFSIAAVRVFIV